MHHRTAFLILSILALVSLPGYLSAQDLPPPPCCNLEGAPPPDTPLEGEMTALSQYTVSDAALSAAGITRSQFLDALAATLFSGTDQGYSLLIPMYTQLTSSDGGTFPQLSLVQIERSLVASEIIDTLNFILISDGKTPVVIIFEGTASD